MAASAFENPRLRGERIRNIFILEQTVAADNREALSTTVSGQLFLTAQLQKSSTSNLQFE
jgi:hypothetical protein